MEGSPQFENSLEELKFYIATAPLELEKEYVRGSGASWALCAATRLSIIMGFLEYSIEDGLLTPEQVDRANGKLQEAIGYLEKLKEDYPRTGDTVPEERKKGMIERFNILQ